MDVQLSGYVEKILWFVENHQRVWLVYYVTLSLVMSLWRRCFSLKNQADNANWLIIMRNLALKSARWIEMQALQADTFLQYSCEWPNSYTTSGKFFPCTPWTYHDGRVQHMKNPNFLTHPSATWNERGYTRNSKSSRMLNGSIFHLSSPEQPASTQGWWNVHQWRQFCWYCSSFGLCWLLHHPSMLQQWLGVQWSLCGGDYWIIPFAEFSPSLPEEVEDVPIFQKQW